MKQLNHLILILGVLLLASCSTQFRLMGYDQTNQVSAHSLQTSFDGYEDSVNIDTLTEFQFRNKLRTDIGFRLDFARYALSQPRSFDWNNRLLGRQYDSRYNSYYWNRDQMWNDWAWGYTGWNSWGQPHRWSPFGYDRWGYNMHYGWNNHGWNYGWNNGFYNQGWPYWNNNVYGSPYWRSNRQNTSYINGRRGSLRTIESNRRTRTNTTTRRSTNNTRNTKVIINNSSNNNNNTRPIRVIREKPVVPVIRNNNRPVIRNNNTNPKYTPSRRMVTPPRTNTTRPTRSNTTRKRDN